MKLYTEEQVRDILQSGSFPFNDGEVDEIISMITPIELPSDEEISTENEKIHGKDNIVDMGTNLKWAYLEAFEVGAKWVINQIKKQAIT